MTKSDGKGAVIQKSGASSKIPGPEVCLTAGKAHLTSLCPAEQIKKSPSMGDLISIQWDCISDNSDLEPEDKTAFLTVPG